ncbi:MAG: lysophospholipid acyltransferase family protein [Tepidisphaeraceae bacterium]
MAERLLGLPALSEVNARSSAGPEGGYAERVLSALDVRVAVGDADLARVPASGPLIVVANHPFGAIDGLALLDVVRRIRGDVRLLANELLIRIPNLRDACLPVDVFGRAGSARANAASMNRAVRWLRDQAGALIVFPAGQVSSITWSNWHVHDRPWSHHVAVLARLGEASVLPVRIDGRNSATFQLGGLLSPTLRTLLLPREVTNKTGSIVRMTLGAVISPAQLRDAGSDDRAAADYLRARTDALAARFATSARPAPAATPSTAIAPPEDADVVMAELNALPPECTLSASGSYRVVYLAAPEAPHALREVGRLREAAFRAVGEGTGRARDLDRFDDSYIHLICYHAGHRQVVGAYRLGPTDKLAPTRDVSCLYTSTLFRYGKPLLDEMGPALELGRSFVRQEYQREFAPLSLLWKGIAAFVARRPHYRVLFGPVSISNRYHSMTRTLLIEFLRRTRSDDSLAKMIEPRNPPRLPQRGRTWARWAAAACVRSVEAIEGLVGEIEADRRGLPVLLRQYLKLDARLLGFNVDPDFGDALDGLMMVDLTRVSPPLLARYMGREALERYLAHHRSPTQ